MTTPPAAPSAEALSLLNYFGDTKYDLGRSFGEPTDAEVRSKLARRADTAHQQLAQLLAPSDALRAAMRDGAKALRHEAALNWTQVDRERMESHAALLERAAEGGR